MEVRRISGLLFLVLLALFLALCVSPNSAEELATKPLNEEIDGTDGIISNPLERSRRGIKIKLPKSKPKGPVNTYHPPPKAADIKGIPNLERVKPKTPVQGGGGLRSRYEDRANKKTYEWDGQHGELEKYGKTGKHEGSYDPHTGAQLKGAIPGRKIEN